MVAGVKDDHIYEIHGSLRQLQCSARCCKTLYNVDKECIERMRKDQTWIPMCPKCEKHCLRPNVMIFGDDMFIGARARRQKKNLEKFLKHNKTYAVLEIGAGKVIPSIRIYAEQYANKGSALIRINPSKDECEEMETNIELHDKYIPLAHKSEHALKLITNALQL